MKNGACDAMRSTPIFIGVSSAAPTPRAPIVAATISKRAATRVVHELRTLRLPHESCCHAKIRGNAPRRNLGRDARSARGFPEPLLPSRRRSSLPAAATIHPGVSAARGSYTARTSYVARSATASGRRAARTAGNTAPMTPTPHAHDKPVTSVDGVIASVVINVPFPPPRLTESPEKISQAITLPAVAPSTASVNDSTRIETTTPAAPNPSARNVAISTTRLLTAAYIVFNAPTSAPAAMIEQITYVTKKNRSS